MFAKASLVTITVLAIATGVGAAEPASQACFADHEVTKVVPHHAAMTNAVGTYERLVGARAFVPAKPGLTGEWLHAQLAKRSAQPQPGTQCPLDVRGVSISVQSGGPGFWVNLAAPNDDDAKEVLRRAKTLTR